MVMITPQLICELQKALGMTTEEFAKALGVSPNTLFQWKSGRRHPKYGMQLELNKWVKKVKLQVA